MQRASKAGKLSVETEPQAVHQIVDAVLEMFAEQAAGQAVALRSELPATLPWVLADASRIVQVFGNLIGNALKFTPAGGSVTIGARAETREMVLWVRDTGTGIPPEDVPFVFDRFWHGEKRARLGGRAWGSRSPKGSCAPTVGVSGWRVRSAPAARSSSRYRCISVARPCPGRVCRGPSSMPAPSRPLPE